MKFSRKFQYALAIASMMALILATISLAYVTTDQQDYTPGSVVTISGDNSNGVGYLPYETVHVDVTGPNGYSSYCDGTANADGAWSCQIKLWEDERAVGSYSYTAHGLESNVSQSGTFTDAPAANVNFATSGLPLGTSVTVSYSGTNNGGHPVSDTKIFTSPGPSSDIGTEPGSSFKYSYPESITVNGTTYSLKSSSPTSPFTIGADKSKTTVSATYDLECTAPTGKTYPQNQTVTYGQDAAFYADSNDASATVKWQESSDGSSWSDITNSNSTSLTVINPVVSLSGSLYRAVFTNSCGSVNSKSATLHINPKAASVTPNAASKTYGEADPALTGTLSGFLAVDNVTATYSRTPGETVAGSPYVISTTLSPAEVLGNYNITYNIASFTISKAILIVTADDQSKILNAPNPIFTSQIKGFQFGETTSVLKTQPTCNTTATQNSPIGSYPITCDGGLADNYTFEYRPGILSIIFRFDGFLQPINDTAHTKYCGSPCVASIFKGGSTIPVKFQLKDYYGNIVQTTSEPIWLTPVKGSPTSSSVDETAYSVSPTTGNTYRWDNTAQQYIYNWSTKGYSTSYYWRIGVTLDDGQTYYVNIGLR